MLTAPGMGDGIQAAKAGILEIGDVFVVNKADRDGADQVRRDLRNMIALADAGRRRTGGRRSCRPSRRPAQGVDEVVEKIDEHRAWMESSGELDRRRVRRARDEIEAIAVTALRRRWGNVHERTELDDLAEQVVAGDVRPLRRGRRRCWSPSPTGSRWAAGQSRSGPWVWSGWPCVRRSSFIPASNRCRRPPVRASRASFSNARNVDQ